MIYGAGREVVEKADKSFLTKGRLRCAVVAASLEEAGEELFTFLSFPPAQWKGLRTTNALERINEEFRRRTKTQAALPNEDAVLLLLFGLLCTGQIRLRRLDGWQDIWIYEGFATYAQWLWEEHHGRRSGHVCFLAA